MPVWCVAPLEKNEGNSLGQGYNRPTGCSAENAPHATFMRTKEDESGTGRVWAAGFSPCYGPFWLGARFET